MKHLLLLSLLIVVSCGKIQPVPGSNQVGFERETKSIKVPEQSIEALRAICNALADRNLSTLSNSEYKFDFAVKNCADESIPQPSEVTTVLSNVLGGFKFILKGSSTFFYFQEVETDTEGSMAPICASLSSSMTSPLLMNGSFLFFTTQNIPTSDCPFVVNEQCVQIDRGIPGDRAGIARIISRDWIRYRLNSAPSRTGFFTYKRNVVQGDCEENQSIVRQAVLK